MPVLRQRNERCPWTVAFGGPERGGNHFRDAVPRRDLGREPSDWPEQAHGVQRLVRQFEPVGQRHGPAEGDNRAAFVIGSRQSRRQVCAAGAGGHETYPRAAGHPADPLGDERGVLFVPADDRLDLRVEEPIKHLVDLRARDREDVLDPLQFQAPDQQIGTARAVGRHHSFS